MEQKQEAEKKDYQFEIVLTGFILVLLLFSGVYFYYQQYPTTGKTFITIDAGKQELEQLLGKLPAMDYLGATSFCVQIVLSPDITHSYVVQKMPSQLLVQPLGEGCNEFSDDLIVRFPSYTKFRDLAKYPTCYKLVNNGRGQNFWFLPSRLWPQGDVPLCNAEFQQKFCPAIHYCIDPKNIPGDALACCVRDRLNAEQQQRAATAAQAGVQKGVREQSVRFS